MNTELQKLFEFQALIIEMQSLVIAAKIKGATEETLKPSVERIDKLIEIYKHFDKYYYAAHFAQQKILSLESDMLVMGAQVDELKKENKKLLETINFSNEK